MSTVLIRDILEDFNNCPHPPLAEITGQEDSETAEWERLAEVLWSEMRRTLPGQRMCIGCITATENGILKCRPTLPAILAAEMSPRASVGGEMDIQSSLASTGHIRQPRMIESTFGVLRHQAFGYTLLLIWPPTENNLPYFQKRMSIHDAIFSCDELSLVVCRGPVTIAVPPYHLYAEVVVGFSGWCEIDVARYSWIVHATKFLESRLSSPNSRKTRARGGNSAKCTDGKRILEEILTWEDLLRKTTKQEDIEYLKSTLGTWKSAVEQELHTL